MTRRPREQLRENVTDQLSTLVDADVCDPITEPELDDLLDWYCDQFSLPDRRGIGPGTSRVTIGATAVYVVDRALDGRLTQQRVADVASALCPTSRSQIGSYSPALAELQSAVK